MTSLLVRHEWRLLRREGVFWGASALLLLATGYAFAGGLSWQQERLEETALTTQEGAEYLSSLREAAQQSGGSPAAVRTYAAMPPGPLAAFSVGLSDLAPERAEISIFKRPDNFYGRYQIESPLSLMAGRFDLSFVVLFLMPLFILILSYNVLSAEREDGTLAMVMTQPVSLARLLGAKLLLRLGLLTVFLAALGVAGAVLSPGAAGQVPRLLGWLAVAWLYGVFWLTVAALVASFVRRSETCAATLAALWLLFLLVVPGFLGVGAQAASPLPSRLELVSEMRAASAEAAKESADILAKYYHEHPELAANGEQGGFIPAYFASQRQVDDHLAPLIADFGDRLEHRQALVSRWSVLSPAVLAQEAMMELAGSGLSRRQLFDAEARAFLSSWHDHLAPYIFRGESLMPSDFDALPTFDFAEPPVGSLPLAAALLALLVPSVFGLAVARRRLRHLPVSS